LSRKASLFPQWAPRFHYFACWGPFLFRWVFFVEGPVLLPAKVIKFGPSFSLVLKKYKVIRVVLGFEVGRGGGGGMGYGRVGGES
jgi:hypothetical protein